VLCGNVVVFGNLVKVWPSANDGIVHVNSVTLCLNMTICWYLEYLCPDFFKGTRKYKLKVLHGTPQQLVTFCSDV